MTSRLNSVGSSPSVPPTLRSIPTTPAWKSVTTCASPGETYPTTMSMRAVTPRTNASSMPTRIPPHVANSTASNTNIGTAHHTNGSGSSAMRAVSDRLSRCVSSSRIDSVECLSDMLLTLSKADSRIDVRVQEVLADVEEDLDHDEDEHESHHQRDVRSQHRAEEEIPETVDTEHRLDEDGSPDQ